MDQIWMQKQQMERLHQVIYNFFHYIKVFFWSVILLKIILHISFDDKCQLSVVIDYTDFWEQFVSALNMD